MSLHRCGCEAFRRAAHLPARRLRDLHRRGWDFIAEHPAYAEVPSAPAHRHRRPTNAAMLRFLGRLARLVVGHRLGTLVHQKEWFLAYRRLGPGPVDGPVTTIVPPAGRFYADPFLFSRGDRRFIFYDRGREAAEICYVEIDERGRHSAPRPALRRDCHLSYPFVFADGDEVYMLPETAGHRTVELYRATSFPDVWTLERVLLNDLSARDATLLRHDGRLWLFVAIDVDGTRPIDELFLFSSDSLLGEWEPHPLNPVVTDVRSARSAGRIFRRDGHLVRPAQDCSRAYGWRLVFNRIETLTATDYREVPVGAIEPAPGSCTLRTHSYDSDGEYEVLDAFRMRPRAGIARVPEGPLLRRIAFESPRVERSPVAGLPR